MNKKKQGYVMAVVGSIFVFFNAISYLMDWEYRNSTVTILGLVFIVIGMKRARSL